MHITHIYGFPIVSHCRERARPREIPVTIAIGDRTMNPSEIAVKSPLRPGPAGPAANIIHAGNETFAGWKDRAQCADERRWVRERAKPNDDEQWSSGISVRTCINHSDMTSANRRRCDGLDNGLEISPASIPRRLTAVADNITAFWRFMEAAAPPSRRDLLPITLLASSVRARKFQGPIIGAGDAIRGNNRILPKLSPVSAMKGPG